MTFPVLSSPLAPLPVVVDIAPVVCGFPGRGACGSVFRWDAGLVTGGPFDVLQDALGVGGPLRRCWNSLPGCQYRMTLYDDSVDRSDLNPAYGFHLHDPRLLEYVGAPESARLISRTPEYWIHHMGRDRAMSAALQLQHDEGLILSNLQVLGQFFVTSLNRRSSDVMRWPSIMNRSRRRPSSQWRHLTTWRLWGCSVRRVPRVFLDPCRRHHAMHP